MRPSDFIGLLEATGLPGDVDGLDQRHRAGSGGRWWRSSTASVDDDRPIGTDRNGRDWLTVGHWAQLRAEHGHPDARADPLLGGRQRGLRRRQVRRARTARRGAGRTSGPVTAPSTSRAPLSMTDSCEFREAMRAVDPDIEVGRGRCRRPRRVERLGRRGDGRRRRRHRLLRRPPLRLERRRRRGRRVRLPRDAVAADHRRHPRRLRRPRDRGRCADRRHRAQPRRVHRRRQRTADDDGASTRSTSPRRSARWRRTASRSPTSGTSPTGAERTAPTTASSTPRLTHAVPRTTRWRCGRASVTSSCRSTQTMASDGLGLYGGRGADGSAHCS